MATVDNVSGALPVASPPDAQNEPHLRRALGLLDTTVIAVSSVAPAYSVATALAALGAAVALQMPAAMWVGFFPVMGIAVAYYYMNRRDPNCGASYSWVSKALSPHLGFVTGWVVIATGVIFCAIASPTAGAATLELLNNAHITSLGPFDLSASNTLAAFTVGAIWLIFVAYMVMTGIKIAARFQYVLLAFEYLIVVALGIAGILKHTASNFDIQWLNPFQFGGFGTLAAGVVISVFLYWGWDTAANVNEENRDGAENPGRAGMIGMVALLGIFLISTISVQMVLAPADIAQSGVATLDAWANALFPQPWASLGVLALISSTVATVQTTLLPNVRTAYSMGRDGVLGPVWMRVSRRWRTPAIGTVILATLIIVIMVAGLKQANVNAIVSAGVAGIGILVSFYYGLTGIACAVYYRKRLFHSLSEFLFTGVIPLLSGIALFALAGYLIYADWTGGSDVSFDPATWSVTNLRFTVIVPIIILVLGLPMLIYSRLVHRSPFYKAPREAAPAHDTH